uniref:NADH-ubiquinone oxidoreductase chain 2 n=1 Tax=Cheilomenes sexmaculata TaxID=158622 RepID=A0A0A0S1M0_9CUCU|nr:NADH dehydrogenase subunit 2 [Cheilomenes sexmaculata]
MSWKKNLFLMMMFTGTMISISSSSWINIWIGLEMNLLGFIPLMSMDKFKQSSEISMKYFFVQVSASMMVIFSFLNSFLMSNSLDMMTPISVFMFNCAVLMKMGAAPFHIWYPDVVEGLSWSNNLLMLTWQKIAPMILIMYNFKMNLFFCIIILISMTLGGLKMWNQTSIKKILAFSSINHMGWMMSMMFLNQSMWKIYFVIYMFTTINLIMVLKKFNINNMNELFMLLNNNKTPKFFFLMNLLSMGGIPPFLGFFPKWMTLKMMMENEFYLLSFLMIFLTLISLFIYMRMILQPLMFKMSEKKNYFKNLNMFYIYFMNWMNILGLIIFSLIFSMY